VNGLTFGGFAVSNSSMVGFPKGLRTMDLSDTGDAKESSLIKERAKSTHPTKETKMARL